MGYRLSPAQWSFFKKANPLDIEDAQTISIDTGSSVFKRSYTRYKKCTRAKRSTHLNDVTVELIEWCEECLEHQFYVEIDQNCGRMGSTVKFSFFNEDDAVLFKMTWWNSQC